MTDDNNDPIDKDLLNRQLTSAMADDLRVIAKIIGPRTRLAPMLSEYGAVETWKRLGNSEGSGFTDLYVAKRLDPSIEALIF